MSGGRYLEVRLDCVPQAVEDASMRLAELLNVPVERLAVELLPLDIPRGSAACTVGEARVKAWLDEEAAKALKLPEHAQVPDGSRLSYRWVEQEDWYSAWDAFFKPVKVGRRLIVLPAWEKFWPGEGDIAIYIDPGIAFGTGTHPSTAMCLEVLEDILKPGDSVLDVGTGTGILAIAAAKLGAGRVCAVDIDEAAVSAARRNALRNRVEVEVHHGSVGAAGDGTWRLIVANIGTCAVMELLPEMIRRMEKGGWLVCSGTVCERKQELASAMVCHGLVPVQVKEREGWLAVLATGT